MFKREQVMKQIRAAMDMPVIKIITGIRRCGKSSLLRLLRNELLEKGVPEANILLLDFESLSLVEYREAMALYRYVEEWQKPLQGKVCLLFDEIQEVREWEKVIRSFSVDFACDIVLTGSNANLLSRDLATHLAGRYVEFELLPLSFSEYLTFHASSEKAKDVEQVFSTYLMEGGFPGLALMRDQTDLKIQYLKGIYHTVVMKDVIQRNAIRDAELLERVFAYLMENVGQIFSAKRIADYLKSQGRSSSLDAIYGYIHALEQGMVLYAAKRYDVKGRKVLDRMDKYFLADVGLRYALMGHRAGDIGQILENVVYLELRRRGYQVFVGAQAGKEVDFIAVRQEERMYVQVAYLLASPETVEREFSVLSGIADHYPKWVLSMDNVPIGGREGIHWRNVIDFLLER